MIFMRKNIIFLFFILLLTGCDITYNLNIDDYYTENVTMTENNQNNWDYTFGNFTVKELHDYYLEKEIPYHYNDLYMAEKYERIEGVSYYDVNDLSSDEQIGLSLKAKFEYNDSFSRSNLLWKTCKNKSVTQSSDGVNINVSGFKIFDEYKILDKITVNLKTKYKVIDSNSDSTRGNTYTWVINRGNYRDKTINFSYSTNNILNSDNNNDSPLFTFSICIIVIVFVFAIIIFVFKKRYDSKNSL